MVSLLLQSQPKGEVEGYVIRADNLHEPEGLISLEDNLVECAIPMVDHFTKHRPLHQFGKTLQWAGICLVGG